MEDEEGFEIIVRSSEDDGDEGPLGGGRWSRGAWGGMGGGWGGRSLKCVEVVQE